MLQPIPSTSVATPPSLPPSRVAAADWRDIPVFIVNRNRYTAMRQLIDWLQAGGTRRIVILDNASDYPPLLTYYEFLPAGVNVLRLDQNHGPWVFWQQGIHTVMDTPYVVTDSDIVPTDECPADLIGRLQQVLLRYPDVSKVGPALRIDNIPDGYVQADMVRKWESQFWEHPVAPGVFAAPIDTTFALYPAHAEFSNDGHSLRLGHPCLAEHTPWYAVESHLSDEELYYRTHTSTTFSNWSVRGNQPRISQFPRVVHYDQRARVLNLDGRGERIPGWINAGPDAPRVDLHFDWANVGSKRLPLANSSIDGIHLNHVLEGVRDARPLLDELYRAAKPEAKLVVRVAHGARGDAWQDPAQQRAWTEGSFAHFSQPVQPPGTVYRADWQLESVRLVMPAESERTIGQTPHECDGVREMIVILKAIKPGRAQLGLNPAPQTEPMLFRDDRLDPAFTVCPEIARESADGTADGTAEPDSAVAFGDEDSVIAVFRQLIARSGDQADFRRRLDLRQLYAYNRALAAESPRVARLLAPCGILGPAANALTHRGDRVIGALLDAVWEDLEAGRIESPDLAARWSAAPAPQTPRRILCIFARHINCSERYVESDVLQHLQASGRARGHAIEVFHADRLLYGVSAVPPNRMIDGEAYTPTPQALTPELSRLRQVVESFQPDLVLLEANFLPTDTTISPAFIDSLPNRRRFPVVAVVPDLYDSAPDFAGAWAPEVDRVLCFNEQGEHARRLREAGKLVYFPNLPFVANPHAHAERCFDFVFAGGMHRGRDAVLATVARHVPSHRIVGTDREADQALPTVDGFYRFLAQGKVTFNTGFLNPALPPIQTGRTIEAMLSRTALLEESPAALSRACVPYLHFLPVDRAEQAVAYTQFLARHPPHWRRLVDAAASHVDACYSPRHFWTQLESLV
ncbi:MAG: methyltransferase domain-containing protein [Pseudomonadota bacterium]|nr:methyltransferase domain-containing protein [Pseudomonadota bacterium]